MSTAASQSTSGGTAFALRSATPAAASGAVTPEDIAPSLVTLANAGLALTLLYGLADVTDMLRRGVAVESHLLSYVALLLVPLVATRIGNARPQHAERVALGMDITYTALLAARLLLPDTTVSGTALALSLKMLATALLLHWPPIMQYASGAATLLLYYAFLAISGHLAAPGNAMHQLVGPLLASLLAAVGAANIDRHRRAVTESEGHLRSLLDHMPDGVLVLDATRIAFANPRLATMLGYPTAAELLGQDLEGWVDPAAAADLQTYLGQTGAAPGYRPAIDTRLRRADGTMLAVAVTAAPLRYRHRPAIQVMVRDVTERRRVEEEKAALLDIAGAISGTLDLPAILDRVQRRTATLLDCERVATFVWDASHTGFRLIAEFGTPPELLGDALQQLFPLPGPVAQHLGNLPTIVMNHREAGALPPELLAHFGVQTLAAVPLRVRDRPYGVFATFRTAGNRPFDSRQVELLESIGHQVALAVEMTDLYRAEQEEALVSGTVARVARELIASLNTPALLNRLCELTSEALGADFSLTYLWRSDERKYVAAAGHGVAPEEWDTVRTVKAPAKAVEGLVKLLARSDFVQVSMADLADELLAAVAQRYGITQTLYVPLRNGEHIVGALVAGYRGRQERFGPYQERMARGIAGIASLVLHNARLIDELDRANRLKTDFVATMSHELRTPLNIILGYTGLMMEGTFGQLTGEQSETLRRVDRSAQQLLGLIDSTLDVSRIDAGQVPIELREVDVADVLAETATELRDLWERASLSFHCTVAPDLPRLYTDPVKLKVVLKNLIGNAVKFTERGGVQVSAQPDGGGIAIRVTDTGAGIPAAALPIIFERFRQADSSMTRRHGGVGLGLYIVRRLLDALDGTITVDSTLGRGSTFCVRLPLRPRVVSEPSVRPGAAPPPAA